MNNLKVGFSRGNINPPMGIEIGGYYKVRRADGILDDLEVNALAINSGDKTILMLSLDHCGVFRNLADLFRTRISEATGVDVNSISISATHTHTAPRMRLGIKDKLESDYIEFVINRAVDAAKFAIADLKDAKMGWGIGTAPRLAFVRRYRMKDGSIKTNPGVNNPDIVSPIGDVDERVSVLRFDREGADSIVFAHFGCHPDVVGGCKISADWPGLLRRTVEKVLDNTKCIFFNGAEGDVNHVNVSPRPGEFNGMFVDFDDVSRGYAHAEYFARVITGGVLQAFDKVKYVDVDNIATLTKTIKVPSNMPDPKDIPQAKKISDLHNAGKDDEIPFKGMMLTTVVAEAARMLRLENGPEFFELEFIGLSIGPVAIFGIPGEPFTGIGRAIKETEGYELVLPMCLTNGSQGYFPMYDAYAEGGYEARGSNYKAGVAELIIDEGKKLLAELGE
ncbi:MAG: hypothetical protein E7582_06095 [Ruminococcaceae bacterium]|nr:hypothetical protein [Oscillospiraceae bacterium]